MTETQSGLTIQHVRTAVEAAAAVSSLPAVPTQDWCARAAAAVRTIRPKSVTAVTLAVFGVRGSIVQHEASGAVGTDPSGRVLDGESVHPEHAPSLEWWIETELAAPSQISAGVLADLSCFPRWGESPAGRRWARLGVKDLLVGIAPVPGHLRGRCIAVEIALDSGAPASSGEIEVLRAAIGLLSRRAFLAFGMEASTALNRLTYREQQVLEHLALGKSVKEIAQDLARSPHTVHDHVKSLHRKLNASSRGELIARALGHLAPSGSQVSADASPEAARLAVVRPTLLSA